MLKVKVIGGQVGTSQMKEMDQLTVRLRSTYSGFTLKSGLGSKESSHHHPPNLLTKDHMTNLMMKISIQMTGILGNLPTPQNLRTQLTKTPTNQLHMTLTMLHLRISSQPQGQVI